MKDKPHLEGHPTIKAAVARVRELVEPLKQRVLDTPGQGVCFFLDSRSQEEREMRRYLSTHSSAQSKFAEGIAAIGVMRGGGNVLSDNVCLVVRTPLGRMIPLSIKELFASPVRIASHPKRRVLLAFRHLVRDQISNFKFEQPQTPCARCQRLSVAVDHVVPFTKLVADFLALESADYSDVEIDVGPDRIPVAVGRYADSFERYHGENATYQWLCTRCNSIKGDDENESREQG